MVEEYVIIASAQYILCIWSMAWVGQYAGISGS